MLYQLMIAKLFPTKPLDHRSARWVRVSLRLFGVTAWLLLAFLCVTASGCCATSPTEAPTATVVLFPTFTATPTRPPPPPPPPPPAAPTPLPPVVPMPLPPRQPSPPQTLTLFLSAPLPAPLYYLNETGQIWRIVGAPPEYILEQVTQEATPITDFAISPVHGRLVYVTDDYRDLIEFDPATQQRVVKLADLDRTLPPNGIDWHTKLRAPRYSPDGTQISFAYKGIFLIASGLHSSAEPTLLQADNYSVDAAGKLSNVAALRIYREATWSPTGEYLLLRVGVWESTIYEIYHVQSGIRLTATYPETHYRANFPLTADDWVWGRDGQSGYIASANNRNEFSFAQVDLAQGVTTQLTTTFPSRQDTFWSTGQFAQGPYQSPTGDLYLFLSMKDAPDLFQLYHWPFNGPLQRINETPVTIAGEVLWAPDGRGALIVTDRGMDEWEYPLGPLQWLSPNGDVYPLWLQGHHLQWGMTPANPAQLAS